MAACAVAIAAVWLGVLPLAAKTDGVRRMIERNELRGIDPSAKFYSELPAMEGIIDRMDGVSRRRGDAFWLRNAE